MSSKLKRKNKKMQPAGYSKDTLSNMKDFAKRKTNTDSLIEDSYQNIRLISYQILHDKFGFGQKRIIRVEQTIDKYCEATSNGGLSSEQMEMLLKEKYNIDPKEEANKVPFRERFALTKYRINSDSKQSAGMYLLASIYSYFSLLGVCLKTKFKFSSKQIREVYEWIRYYINTLSRYKQFELKMEDIALCLMEECKYCDSRFVGKMNRSLV